MPELMSKKDRKAVAQGFLRGRDPDAPDVLGIVGEGVKKAYNAYSDFLNGVIDKIIEMLGPGGGPKSIKEAVERYAELPEHANDMKRLWAEERKKKKETVEGWRKQKSLLGEGR